MTVWALVGDPLTPREEHVLVALAEGLTNDEIADELHVSAATVHTHMGSVLAKLGARNRTHAVALAYHLGFLVPMRVKVAA